MYVHTKIKTQIKFMRTRVLLLVHLLKQNKIDKIHYIKRLSFFLLLLFNLTKFNSIIAPENI